MLLCAVIGSQARQSEVGLKHCDGPNSVTIGTSKGWGDWGLGLYLASDKTLFNIIPNITVD